MQLSQMLTTKFILDTKRYSTSLRYSRLSCISDASVNNTKLGTNLHHFTTMEKVNNEDGIYKRGADQVKTIVAGCMSLIAL
jgi:hypothetical protein